MFSLNKKSIATVEEFEETTLVDKLLADQKKLTAVEKFSQKHERDSKHTLAPEYQDLIPIRKPSTGEQYSFSVDLDKCTGCKACVVACHTLNGLDEDESWRDIGKIRSGSTHEQQVVTSACHHCADPACLTGCPVGAYEKIPETGVVKHLDDQCIGCEYCSLKCPYDVPKYNKALGIVRKCDMCHERLAEGEAPACVQACPNGAIKIKLVTTEEIKQRAEEQESIVAGAFRSDYTLPSTEYTSSRELPLDMKAVDEESIEASHKHTPLSWMLMLTQVSVGVSLFEFTARVLSPSFAGLVGIPMLVLAAVLGMAGLITSIFHLGSPFGAWRVFLGLKTSWLSREVVMFGAWMPVLKGYLGLVLAQHYQSFLPTWIPEVQDWMIMGTGAMAIILGLVSVYCSIMVYVDTKRAFWSFSKTTGKFVGSVLIGGGTSLLVVSSLVTDAVPLWVWVAAFSGWLLKAGVELASLLPARSSQWSTHKKSALIQLKTLRKTLLGRWGVFALCVLFGCASGFHISIGAVCLICLIIGEYLERQIFFQAVETLKMPGNLKR